MEIRDILRLRFLSKKTITSRTIEKDGKEIPLPENEFHRQRMVKAGHWRYMGHDIVRVEDTKLWYVEPVKKRSDKLHPAQLTKEHHVYKLNMEYFDLCKAVVEIERERYES